MKTITLTDEQMAMLNSGQSITIDPPKPKVKQWEPKSGGFFVGYDGEVQEIYYPKCHCSARYFGVEYETREQAEKAAAAMRKHNRLLAYVAEFGGDWVADWGDGELDKWFVYYSHNDRAYERSLDGSAEDLGKVYMSKECAKGLLEKLNSGEVIL